MKILFIQPYFTYTHLFSNTLARYLAAAGHSIEIASYVRTRHQKSLLLKNEKFTFHFLNAVSLTIPPLFKEFPYFLSLKKTISQVKPDIIHINNLPFLTSYQSAKLSKKLGIPCLVHVHGTISKTNKLIDLLQYLFMYTFGKIILKDAKTVVCLTRSDALAVCRFGCPPQKIQIIPNGVNVDKFKPSSVSNEPLVFWSGRFVATKGLDCLIKAMAIVVKSKPKAKLMLAGDGPLLSKISGLVQRFGLQKNVIFTGRLCHDGVAALVSASMVCVLPSLKEGMPYALLEAMSCGKPVVGTDISGINDIITDGVNGVLVQPNKPEELARAIILLLEDGVVRERIGGRARQLMVERYDLQKIAKLIEKVYCEALGA